VLANPPFGHTVSVDQLPRDADAGPLIVPDRVL